ncbi:hypothetical protein [Fusobacterium mortiferum]|uniref:hypothetical protein n=1 Tax=Fusobacterium mortiferum TaxID=850 RepID=UPI001956151C|nr:hypothetical protein [Fusobacterium mortiferum]
MSKALKTGTKLFDVPEEFRLAASFVNSFKLTRYDIKYAPPWELSFVINRAREERVNMVREYIKWAGGRVL